MGDWQVERGLEAIAHGIESGLKAIAEAQSSEVNLGIRTNE